MKNISFFGQKFEPVSFILVLLSIIILFYLGTWQIERRKEKLNFISQIDKNIANPPTKLDNKSLQENNTMYLYSKIELDGHFLDDQNIFLYGRRSAYPEKDGYYLLSPFQDISGNIYLVPRAWIPQSAKKDADSFKSRNKETIVAFVMQGEKKSFFVPDNDLKNNIWFTLDLNQAKSKVHLINENFYLMQIDSDNLPEGGYPLTSKYLNVVRNDHLEYAITWYSLAGFLGLIYYLFNKKRSVTNS